MQKQKGILTLIGIIIIVAVAIIFFGGVFAYQYFATKQLQLSEKDLQIQQILNKPFFLAGEPTTQTAGWKTYKNDEYGFEIKYPNDLQIKIRGSGKVGVASLISLDIDKNPQENIYVPVYIRLVAEGSGFVLGTRDWEDYEIGQIKGRIACGYGACEIIFGGATKQDFYIQTEKNPQTDSTTKQILSTFRFIQSKNIAVEKSVQIISPVGGEILQAGKKYIIKWETKGFSQNARVYVTLTNDDPVFNEIGEIKITDTVNTGSYEWSPMFYTYADNSKNKIGISVNENGITKQSGSGYFSVIK